MPEKPPLPEEFAPTGPRLSRLPIQAAPPTRPRLFADEARFALRLSLLAGGTELATWSWMAAAGGHAGVLALAALRLLRPFWARLGTRLPRTFLAAAMLVAALVLQGRFFWWAGLAAVADLCATCIADSITVERRASAYAWLDMGQALGAMAGLALGLSYFSPLVAAAALALAFAGVRELHDRGTPRSAWPAASYLSVLRTPLAAQLAALAFVCGVLGMRYPAALPRWVALLLPVAGMAAAARIEPLMRNAAWLPRIAVLLAAAAWLYAPLGPAAMGVMFAAIPAAVARGAGEMERPLASSLAWSALTAGGALGAVLGF